MVQSTTNTAELIQDQVASLLVEPLEAASIFLSAGPRIFDSSEPLKIPTLKTGFTPSFVGENEDIPDDQDADFGTISLMPSDRKSIKRIVRFSNESLRQTTVALDAVLKQRLVTDVASALDTALLTGDGADKSITGLFNQPGMQTGPLDLADPDTFLDGLAQATGAEVTPNKWFMNNVDFYTVRKIKDGDGRYILEADITEGTTYRLFGVPVVVSAKVPAGTVALVDMTNVAVVRDLAPSITILSELYAKQDQQGIRVITRYDLGLLHSEAVVLLTGSSGE